MGFGQLHLYNRAMLAKQLLQLWRNPEKLLSRMLRARYFPNGDVFTACLGSRPSFTWRSVMAAQALFRTGCHWYVGSGSQICVWSDPRLPCPRSFHPTTPAPSSLAHLRVADLIEPDGGDWKMDFIQEVICRQ
ncbi:UNVERIFIED_CONTAM: hypothetical protein Sangu_2534500 [Sesamum angustifolium]|uniref:Uncharacterized protein n=1 Tax=Sesamum angustifolium TaxID=2727405 RepID=A0AAW2J9F9_9LAMI